MTHVELLQAEKKKYIEEGEATLDAAAEWLHRFCDEWDEKHEDYYVGLIQQSVACMHKAVAINDILVKLGVSL
jgi:hypothetical protein